MLETAKAKRPLLRATYTQITQGYTLFFESSPPRAQKRSHQYVNWDSHFTVCKTARAVEELEELELELIQTQMTQKPMLRAEVGMRVRCANKASAE